MSTPPPAEMLRHQEDRSDHASAVLTAGQMLRQARQAKGVHLAVLAVALKVPVRQLEALEADQYDAFKGGPTFLRAVTSAMCRHLGVDAAPVLALLPAAISSMAAPRRTLTPASGMSRASFAPARGVSRSARRVLWLAAAMLLVIAAFLWLPSPTSWWPGASSEPAVTAAEEVAVPLGQAANPEATEEATASAPGATTSEPVAAPAPAPAASGTAAPALAPLQSAAPGAAEPAASSAVLRLEASGDTWVDVRDAKGLVLGKLLKSGDALEISPAMPYQVVIGRAAAVKAFVRGQPFDLKPHTPVSVARFEVKQ